MAFGTLRRDSFFAPAEVLDEARELDGAVRALASVLANHIGDDGFDPDFLAGWNAFNDSWRAFWADCNAWDGWVFRTENSTRDQLLNFEDQYASFKSLISDRADDADVVASLPDAAPESARTEDNIKKAADDAGNIFKKIGWETIASAAIVVVGAVFLLAVAKRGGLPVPG